MGLRSIVAQVRRLEQSMRAHATRKPDVEDFPA
jgi:hypothetical protein